MSCAKVLIAKHIPQVLLIALLWSTSTSAQNLDLDHKENGESPGIESALLRVYQAWASDRPALAKRTALQYSSQIKPTGKIVVILEPETNYDISQINIADLENLNAEVLAQSKSLMRVAVPVSNLPRLTNIPGVSFVRTPMKPQVNRVTSEGVENTQATTAHALSIRGAGVKVGIIDNFEKALEAQRQGDLPSNWRYVDYTNEGIYTGGVHGTACAEVVHDMAPDAELILIKIGDLVDFENAKDMAIREGIDILSVSFSWLGTGFGDGLGLACDVVNNAFDNDILWVNSAGNYASSLYSGLYRDSDIEVADGWHNFEGDDEVLTLMDITVGDEIEIWLTWNDFPRTSENYDLVLTKSKADGTVDIVEKSETFQRNSPPVEHIVYEVTEIGRYGVAVWKSENARTTVIKIFSSNHDFEGIESIRGSIGVPADARGSLTVGAIPHWRWQTGPQEPFSSQGPTIDGRIKPDIMGPDGVNTFTYGSNGFFGTSAATPHIAGAAALIKSSNPENFTAQTLRNKLIEATVDLGARGKDNIHGYGRLDLSLLDLQPRIDVSNVVVSLDLIPGSGAGNQINDSVTSGTVSGQGTKIAVEVFAKGVITPLIGVKIEFEFKAEELKLDKVENSAFLFAIPEPTGVNFAATAPVTLPESDFIGRAEFTTVSDVTGREFTLGIKRVTLAQSASLSDEITTTNVISFNKLISGEFAGMQLHLDTQIETPAIHNNTLTIPEQKAGDTIQLQLFVPMAAGKQTYGYEIELDLPGKTFSDNIGSISGTSFTGASLFPTPGRPILSALLLSAPVVPTNGYLGQIDLQVINTLEAETTLIVKAASMAGHNRQQDPLDVSNAMISFSRRVYPGDFDGDLDVDFADFLAFAGVLGLSSSDTNYDARMDMNSDGIINFADFLVFVGVFGSTAPVRDPEPVPGGPGRIAYIKQNLQTGSFHLHIVDPDGTNPINLNPIDDLAEYSGQSWSSDGSQLAFASNRSGNANFNIFVMNTDGSNIRSVVEDSGNEFASSWSPDGQKILFQTWRNDETAWDIYVVNIGGSDEQVLINTDMEEQLPVWSPDGTKFAYQAGHRGQGIDIYVANADGTGAMRLTDGNGTLHAAPAWSPDGMQIAFESNRHQPPATGTRTPLAQYEIYVMNRDGSNMRRLTSSQPLEALRNPTWSPDGKQIAFEFHTYSTNLISGFSTIKVMNVDGSNVYSIPNLPPGARFPRWSPVP